MHHLARTLLPGSVRHLLPRSPKRVVVVGGGPTGLFCAERLRHHFEVTVIDPKEYFEFAPGILRALADPSHFSNITFNYREILERQLGVEFVLGEACGIETSEGPHGRGSVGVTSKAAPGPSRLHFDYCILAAGSGNGIWKPRCARGTEGHSSDPSGVASSSLVGDESRLEDRRAGLRTLRERIATSHRAIVVGAGLVGVELAGELAHFFPKLEVSLVDGAPVVLPQLAEGARQYAHAWLEQQGVKVHLGESFEPQSVDENQGDIVLWCVGTTPRAVGLFDEDAGVYIKNAQIQVNKRMQVLMKVTGSNDPASETTMELEPVGQGRIFAVGDVAKVVGVPTAGVLFHGEEMAAVAVSNIEAAESVLPTFAAATDRREAEMMGLLCCASLGPRDGIFATQSEAVASGTLAAIQKQMIEATKMSALRGELTGSLFWMPVHH